MTVATQTEADALSPTVAKRIRGLLGEQGFSQAQLARWLGVSQMYVSDRVRIGGTTPIDLNDLQRIAQFLGVDVIDLLPNGGRMQVTPYSTTPAPHAVDVRSPRARARARSRFAQAVEAA